MESSEEDQPNYFEASDGSWRDYVGLSVILVQVTMDLHSHYIFLCWGKHYCNYPTSPGRQCKCKDGVRKKSLDECFKKVLMWTYNIETDSCEQFFYLGCGGNANRWTQIIYLFLSFPFSWWLPNDIAKMGVEEPVPDLPHMSQDEKLWR